MVLMAPNPIWAVTSAIPWLSIADRPEIKDDVGEVITSFVNTSAVGHYTTWYTCGEAFEYTGKPKFEFLLKDSNDHETWHGLVLHGEPDAEAPQSIPDIEKVGQCHGKILKILYESSKQFADAPSFVSHTKFLVPPTDDKCETFKTVNKAMVEDTNLRCWNNDLFVGGYVLEDILSNGWYHVYNKYVKDHASCTPNTTSAEAAKTSDIYKKWKDHRGDWLALPNHINQQSDRMFSRVPRAESQEFGTVKSDMIGRWVTCSGPTTNVLDSKFTPITMWPMDTVHPNQNEDPTYFFLQLFDHVAMNVLKTYPEPKETWKPKGTNDEYTVQCRYQNLDFLKYNLDKPIQETDSDDIIMHTEYEIATPHAANFLAATEAMLNDNKEVHKQAYIFQTTPYNANEVIHVIQVFNDIEDFDKHNNKDGTTGFTGFPKWKDARKAANGEWVKLADGFSKHLELAIVKEI